MGSFASRIIRWQARHGRHDLPWQASRDAYRIWISEVMLQQTQVAAVLPYYERFLARFPTVAALAAASEEDVLALWSGLGYYARARNLHRAARLVAANGGAFPAHYDALVALPGIGRSTAAAIAAFASGERRAILDGNVLRVIARHAGIGGDPAGAATAASLWSTVEERLPRRGIEGYTQGLMDLGATLCTARAPACTRCPVAADCVARIEGRWHELPGKRKPRERPTRAIAMLVVVDRGEVLLEKRPASGVWGGLWSLPEGGEGEAIAEVLRRDWKLTPRHVERLEPFTHGFTHFALAVTPWLVRARRSTHSERRGLWLPLAEVPHAALPSPVRRLLSRSASAGAGSDAARQGASSRR